VKIDNDVFDALSKKLKVVKVTKNTKEFTILKGASLDTDEF